MTGRKKQLGDNPNWGGARKITNRPKGNQTRIKTSITLEPDLKNRGHAIAKNNGDSFPDLVNELLRIDLERLYAIARKRNQSLSEVINGLLRGSKNA